MKKPTKKQYREALFELLEGHTPRSQACGKCGWPVLDEFCCRYCGDTNPYEDKKGREVRDWK